MVGHSTRILCSTAAPFRALNRWMHWLTEQDLSALRMLRIARIAASLPLLCPAQTWKETTCVNDTGLCHLHNTLSQYITFPTPIGRTAPSPLSRGMSRFAKIPRGSIDSVPKRRVIAAISNGNRTEWSPIRSVIILEINKSGSPICLITSMITDRIGRHEVLLPINHNFNKICDILGSFFIFKTQ